MPVAMESNRCSRSKGGGQEPNSIEEMHLCERVVFGEDGTAGCAESQTRTVDVERRLRDLSMDGECRKD